MTPEQAFYIFAWTTVGIGLFVEWMLISLLIGWLLSRSGFAARLFWGGWFLCQQANNEAFVWAVLVAAVMLMVFCTSPEPPPIVYWRPVR